MLNSTQWITGAIKEVPQSIAQKFELCVLHVITLLRVYMSTCVKYIRDRLLLKITHALTAVPLVIEDNQDKKTVRSPQPI